MLVGAAARKHWFSGASGWPWGWAKRAPAVRAFSLRQRNAGAVSWKLGHPTLKSLSARGCGRGTESTFLSTCFIYLFLLIFLYSAAPGLGYGMRDLPSSLLQVGSFIFFLVVTCQVFSCSMWDLVPWLGIKLRPLELGEHSFSHRSSGEVSPYFIVVKNTEREILLTTLKRIISIVDSRYNVVTANL